MKKIGSITLTCNRGYPNLDGWKTCQIMGRMQDKISVNNEKGQIFENLISNSDISLLNSGSKTHYHIQTGTYSTIDLSICSSDCFLDFDHTVLENLHGSDHYPIHLKINSNDGPVISSGRLKFSW